MSDFPKSPLDKGMLREKAPVVDAPLTRHVFVCTGKSCSANGSEAVLEMFWKVLAEKGLLYGKRGSLDAPVIVTTCGSIGLCQVGPAVVIYPDGVWYYQVQPEDVAEIAEEHLIHGRPVQRLLARHLPAVEV
jgi:(2Fe-2S) ferredoxin